MPMRTRSRMRMPTRRRAISRKRTRMSSKSKRRVTFKSKALMDLNKRPRERVFYETSLNGTPALYSAPDLSAGTCIQLNPNANQYDSRLASSIFLKGLRIRCFFQNRQLRPVVCHIALIRPKNGQSTADTNLFRANFFKRMGQGSTGPTQLGMGFNDVPNGMMYATQPINSLEWNVIWHTRFKLGVTSTTGGYSSGELKNYRTVARYIKINRVINFPDQTSFFPDTNEQIYLVVWSCPLDYDRIAEPEPNPNSLQSSQHVVMVYKRGNGA